MRRPRTAHADRTWTMALDAIRARRSYQAWVANETIEDYSLRYAASSFRKWSPFVIANTALGGISFLALEAIGGAITISYGFANAFPAILLVSLLIFLTSLPIAYYSSKLQHRHGSAHPRRRLRLYRLDGHLADLRLLHLHLLRPRSGHHGRKRFFSISACRSPSATSFRRSSSSRSSFSAPP